MGINYTIKGYRKIVNTYDTYPNFPDMSEVETKTDTTEYYTIYFVDINVEVEMPIFNHVGDKEYLEISIENRFISESNNLK
jgi:hypothetical protein